jgi:predicted N-formylglutamate amidohydrolase
MAAGVAGAESPVRVQNAGACSDFVLLGDHAGCEVPAALDGLGIAAADLKRHIGWDIGVQALGDRLSQALGACFLSQRFSRLVIDCNRDPDRPDAIPEVSDGVAIPGNAGLSPAARSARVERVFRPYHEAIAAELDGRRDRRTALVALHSFTPVMAGIARPWRFGVLHMDDSPLSDALLRRLRREPGLGEVGDNQPYRMDGTDYTIPHHAHGRGLDYVEIEVRQDLIAEPAGQAAVAALLARLLPLALRDTAR